MNITHQNGYIKIKQNGIFSAQQTFTCGQCFRWKRLSNGHYQGSVRGSAAEVGDEDGCLCITCSEQEFHALWSDYFDCALDYRTICQSFAVDDFTAAAAEFGAGIRILNQEPWEALCTFILSQCNNIPRITAIVERLCTGFGQPLADSCFAFPTSSVIASCSPDTLAPLRAGYRAPYLIYAAQAVENGLDLEALHALPTAEARQEIMQLHGVGRKVADCFLLFGLHKLDAFPVDTWMKKAAVYYQGDMTRFIDSPWAGIYQQYFFYYTREHFSK